MNPNGQRVTNRLFACIEICMYGDFGKTAKSNIHDNSILHQSMNPWEPRKD